MKCVYIVELKLSSQSLLFSGEFLCDNPPVFNDSHIFWQGLLGNLSEGARSRRHPE